MYLFYIASKQINKSDSPVYTLYPFPPVGQYMLVFLLLIYIINNL